MKFFFSLLGILALIVVATGSASAQALTEGVGATPSASITSPLDSSTELYNQLLTLKTTMLPTLDAADRWSAAVGAGLSAQPGEFDALEARLLDFQDQAADAVQRAKSADVDPHVLRAAEATYGSVHEFVVAIQLTDIMFKTSPSGTASDSGARLFSKTINSHLDRFVALNDVANNELQAYAVTYKTSHALAA